MLPPICTLCTPDTIGQKSWGDISLQPDSLLFKITMTYSVLISNPQLIAKFFFFFKEIINPTVFYILVIKQDLRSCTLFESIVSSHPSYRKKSSRLTIFLSSIFFLGNKLEENVFRTILRVGLLEWCVFYVVSNVPKHPPPGFSYV